MTRLLPLVLALIVCVSACAAQAAEIVFDTFAGDRGAKVADRTPDKASAPGGKWTAVNNPNVGIRAEIAISNAPDEYQFPMMVLDGVHSGTGVVAVPLSSQGAYTKPKKFTISAEFVGLGSGPRPALGFYSALPVMPATKEGEPPAKGEAVDKNFTGLVLTPFGAGLDNGTLALYVNGKTETSMKYTGSFDQTQIHRLSYDVDTATGAISNVSLTGSTSDYSSLKTTAFTDAATAYAAVGYVFACGNDAKVGVHNFVVGSDLTLPPLPPAPKKPWIPEKPGLLVQFKAPDYDPKTAIWKDSSGNGNDAKGGVPEMRPTVVPNATPNGSPAVQGTLKGNNFDTWMVFKPVDISTPTGFTVLVYMVLGRFDDDIHSEFLSGEPASLSLHPFNGHLQLCTAWSTVIGNNKSDFKPDTWAIFAVHGTMGKTATFRFNGADDGTVKMPVFAPSTRTFQFFHVAGGKIAELRIYNQDLSTEEIQKIEKEFIASYGAPKTDATK